MTIPYAYRLATSRGVGNFYKTLLVWHGSVYKLIWRDFIIYVIAYTAISLFYRYYLLVHQPDMATKFDQLVLHFRANNSRIPIVFVLSFFVAIINERWWSQILLIPWPDAICLQTSVLVQGQDRRGRLLRRTIARYINLSIIMTFQLLSHDVKMRFPTLESYCDAGLLLPHELAILKSLKEKMNYPFYYVPIVWACSVVNRAREENRISHDLCKRNLFLRIEKLRGQLQELLSYDVVFVPLAYTQVATIAVYVYFIVALIGNQFVKDPKEKDVYVPIFGLLEFVFFVGWLKTAEAMLNPYGNDDDDFELDWIIDRNIQVSYLMVDEVHRAVPTSLRKFYYETVLRKPFYVAKRRKDGTYSNEHVPKKYAPVVPVVVKEEEEEGPRPSEVQELFESFKEEEKGFQEVFEDLLTKSPPPTPTESRDVVVDVPGGSGSSDEMEAESLARGHHRHSVAPGVSEALLVGSSHRLRRLSRESIGETDVISMHTPRRPSNYGRRLSLETAAPGTYRAEPRVVIQALSQPDEIIPLVRASVVEPAAGEVGESNTEGEEHEKKDQQKANQDQEEAK